MSVIQRIRDKAAWLIFAAIALAMIGFIVTDAFQGGGGGWFNSQSTAYGKVNGTEIEYNEYAKRVKAQEDQYGSQMNDYLRQNIQENTWNQMVEEILMKKAYADLDLHISDKEIGDILYGKNPPDQLRQAFTNPETGMYDPNTAYQQIQKFKKETPDQYRVFIESIIDSRQRQKYLALIVNSTYVPKWLVEKTIADNSQVARLSYVAVPYTSVPDSSVKVTDEDIEEFIKTRPDEFKQEESRGIAYVAFSAQPSAADSVAIRTKLESLKNEFATTEDIKGMLIRSNSEIPYYDGFISGDRIQNPNKDSILSTPQGTVYGPYLDAGNYMLARMVGVRQLPDTSKVRHILVSTHQQDQQTRSFVQIRPDTTAKRIIDSIQLAIRNGANFDSLLLKYSEDPGSKDKGGIYDSVSTGMMSPTFNDFIFTNGPGAKGVVKTEYGYHYLEVLSQKGSRPAYKVAYLSSPIFTSPETENSASGLASEFAARSRTAKDFDANVAKQPELKKLIISDIRPGAMTLPELGANRELIRWIYSADQGDVVEQPFAVGDFYVVAMVTEINKPGTMSAAKARPMVETFVRNHKKAAQIKQKIGTPASLEAVASANGQQVQRQDSLSFGSTFIPNLGQELKVIGSAFNKEWFGKLTPAIEGNIGVFVVKPESVIAVPNAGADIEQQRNTILMQQRSAGMQAVEALKAGATIKDYRAKF